MTDPELYKKLYRSILSGMKAFTEPTPAMRGIPVQYVVRRMLRNAGLEEPPLLRTELDVIDNEIMPLLKRPTMKELRT
jgi:hypothetical protein